MAFHYARAMAASFETTNALARHLMHRIWFFAACGPIQADVALERFAPSKLVALREDAARIFGSTRFSRATGTLIAMVENDPPVESTAAWARVMIGGERALTALRQKDSEAARRALALRAAELPEDWIKKELAREASWALVRGAGFQRLGSCRAPIEGSLDHREPIMRACGALALARLDGGATLPRLERVHGEASDHMERLFAALAIVHLAPARFPDLEMELRRDLARDSFFFETALQEDILSVLAAVATPAAARLHDAWKGLYPPSSVTWHA